MNTLDRSNQEIAIALTYDGEHAPNVSAKGHGALADEIIRLAEAHDVPLKSDPELSALLAQIPVGDEVPETLYRAVAEVIAFAYFISGKVPPGYADQENDEKSE